MDDKKQQNGVDPVSTSIPKIFGSKIFSLPRSVKLDTYIERNGAPGWRDLKVAMSKRHVAGNERYHDRHESLVEKQHPWRMKSQTCALQINCEFMKAELARRLAAHEGTGLGMFKHTKK